MLPLQSSNAHEHIWRRQSSRSSWLWPVTRAGNVFTTHTPVAAGFYRFTPELMRVHFEHYVQSGLGIPLDQVLALGRQNPNDPSEPFSMAYLALRGSGAVNGVSRLHGQVSRR